MFKTYPDLVLTAGQEIDLYVQFPDSANKILLVQNKSASPVVLRTSTSTDNSGISLVTPYSIQISSTGTLFIKNTGYSGVTVSVTEVDPE